MRPASRPALGATLIAPVVFMIAALVSRSLVERWLSARGWSASLSKELSYLVVPAVLLLLMSPYLKRHQRDWLRLVRLSDLSLQLVSISICVGLLMRVSYWATSTALVAFGFADIGSSAAAGVFVDVFVPSLPILVGLLVTGILVPATEEIMHRGFILHALLQRAPRTAVILSALIFAALHGPQTYVVAFLAGILLGTQVLSYGTLWAPFITHSTFNASVVVERELLYVSWGPPEAESLRIGIGMVSAAVSASTIVVAMLLVNNKPVRAAVRPRPDRRS